MKDSKQKAKLITLLRTTRGQIDAVLSMIDEGKQCTDVLTQILSAQGLIKKSIVVLFEDQIKNCLNDAVKNSEERENKINEIVSILSKFSKT